MKLACAIERISTDLAKPEVREATSRLAKYVYAHKESIKHLSYLSLTEITGTQNIETILLVVQYCTGSRIELLDQRFELILGNNTIELEDEYVYEAAKDGILINPITGLPVKDYKNHLFPYFIPGKGVE